MNAMQMIEAALAMPHTHAVVTKFADGKERRFTTRNLASAENYAIGERRKIGRCLISRNEDLKDGPIVRVVSVSIEAI